MLHINKIRENKENYITLLKVKNMDATDLFDAVIAKDFKKEQRMKELGITVLRFRDEEIYYHLPSVLNDIEKFIDDFQRRNRE